MLGFEGIDVMAMKTSETYSEVEVWLASQIARRLYMGLIGVTPVGS